MMSTAVSQTNQCQRCGGQLPKFGVVGGRCPRCLFELGLESASEAGKDTLNMDKSSGVTPTPVTIGRYRILRVIGEGGMGIVYEAEQDQPRRTVALKIIKPTMASPQLLRRFEQESQALGRLQHPGIAQIYEAGTVDAGFGPQPYFAMEYIRGISPRDYAESHHLNTSQRMEIMVKICDAVHHAHQRGLIHRDLKPANILVDDTGQPKVLDFGVARVTDSDTRATIQTDMGQLIGTLAYMSPEQAMADPLDIDTRSDVYALGVILYELLVGRLPYPISKKIYETIQTIREEEPTRLGTLNRSYRGDIETIVGKALEKDRTRRFASAAGMAADLRRFLRDEPIAARPPSTSYQLQKFARRHKVLVSAIAAVFAVLVAGIVVSLAELRGRVRAESALKDEKNHLSAALAKAQAETLRATVNEKRALAAEKLSDVSGIPAQAAQLVSQGNYSEAEKIYVTLVDSDRLRLAINDPISWSHMIALAEVYIAPLLPGSQRRYDAAETLFNEVIERQKRFLGENAPDTLETKNKLADLYGIQGKVKLPDANRLWKQVVEGRQSALKEENALTLTSRISQAEIRKLMGYPVEAVVTLTEVRKVAEELTIKNNPLGQQILSLLRLDGTGASNLEQLRLARYIPFDFDIDNRCNCTSAVIVSPTNNSDFGPYLKKAIGSIRSAWFSLRPEASEPGTHKAQRVVVRFAIASSGVLQEMRLVSSSGNEKADHAAAVAIQSSSPFPNFPADFKGDHTDIQLAFSRAGYVVVSGRVVSVGGNETAPPFLLSFAGGAGRDVAAVLTDGKFRIQLPLGDYRISASGLPDGYYLKSIQMDSTDLTHMPLKLQGVSPGEIVMTIGAQP